jgi:hypothetical protein
MSRNHKQNGEKGERVAIGELAKYDIDVAIPMSDNHPYDFIIIINDKFYRAQVKSSTQILNGSLMFALKKNNWYKRTSKKYTSDDIDVMILCDYSTIYLLTPLEFNNKSSFAISFERKGVGGPIRHSNTKYQISKKRIQEVFI